MYLVKVQCAYINFYWFFIDVSVCMLIFYSFSFRHLNAGTMALPTGDRWKCHHYVGQYGKVDTKVILHYQIMTIVLIFRDDVLHTNVAGGVHGVTNVLVIRAAF